MKPPKYKLGERVRILDVMPENESDLGTVAAIVERGQDCDLYLIDCDNGTVAQFCDCYLDTAMSLSLDFGVTVPWSEMPWAPRTNDFPTMLSGVLRRVRAVRLGRSSG